MEQFSSQPRIEQRARRIFGLHIEMVPASSQGDVPKGVEGFYTVMHRRRICPAFSPESPDDGASGLERQTRSQKCKYRPANQSDWYHSLECPSFTDVYTVAVRHNRRNAFLNRGIVRIRAYICAAYVHTRMYRSANACGMLRKRYRHYSFSGFSEPFNSLS